MKTIRSESGPVGERPHFKPSEIDRICSDELRKHGLFPSSPQPVRIDRFVEKRFGVVPRYEDLPDGVLGYTKFSKNGVNGIVISAALDTEGAKVAERRIRTTLAHESGHGLLHAYLFALDVNRCISLTMTAILITRFFAEMFKAKDERAVAMTGAGGNFRQTARSADCCVHDRSFRKRSSVSLSTSARSAK
jgi:hypothetical protein